MGLDKGYVITKLRTQNCSLKLCESAWSYHPMEPYLNLPSLHERALTILLVTA